MSKYFWLIDAGHGGIKDGKYVTAPAKMHRFDDGFTIYEGVTNRKIAAKLAAMLHDACIDFGLVYDEVLDISLTERARIVNSVFEAGVSCRIGPGFLQFR